MIKVGKQNSCELTHCLESRCPTSSFPILRNIRDWNANVCWAYLRRCCNSFRLHLSVLGKQKRLGWLSILLRCYPTPLPSDETRRDVEGAFPGIDTEIVCQPGNFPCFKQTQPDNTSTATIVTPDADAASLIITQLGIELINNFLSNFNAGASADVSIY